MAELSAAALWIAAKAAPAAVVVVVVVVVVVSEAAFESGKWGDRPRPHSWGGPALQAFMINEKNKFVRQVVKVDLV